MALEITATHIVGLFTQDPQLVVVTCPHKGYYLLS